MTQPSPAGGLGGAVSPSGSGAEPRRQTHFGNNLLKRGWEEAGREGGGGGEGGRG